MSYLNTYKHKDKAIYQHVVPVFLLDWLIYLW